MEDLSTFFVQEQGFFGILDTKVEFVYLDEESRDWVDFRQHCGEAKVREMPSVIVLQHSVLILLQLWNSDANS